MNNVFKDYAEKYWNKELTVTPIKPNTKEGTVGWPNYIDNVPSDSRKADWLDKYARFGVGLLTGKTVYNGHKIIAIDVDDDSYVGFISRLLGPVISGKKGKKGITVFVLADKEVKHTAINFKKSRIIDVLVRKCCVLPPTVHKDTGKPYEWIGLPLYDCDLGALPVVSREEIHLLKAIIEDENHLSLLEGQATHDAALSLTARLASRFHGDDLLRYLDALLPDDYRGDLRDELPELISSAKEKELGKYRRAPYEAGEVGPVPMGYTDNGYYVFLHQKKNILQVTSSNSLMSIPGLCDLAPYEFWEKLYPKYDGSGKPVPGFNSHKVGNALMEACRNYGPFIASRVRGCGIWHEGDDVVQNLRGELPVSDRYIYVRFETLPPFDEAKSIEAERLYNWLKLFNWGDPGYATLLLGWVALAPICGVLKWRTHIFIHGAKKTGKSTLIKGMNSILDPMLISLDGTSSEAGIRQSIGADSRPVILDEFESDNKISRMQQILKLARSASSGAAPIARGTPEGRAMQFQVHSSFCFGAITPIIGSAADRSRIVELELAKHDDDEATRRKIEEGQRYFDENCLSWCSQMVELIEPILESIEILREELPSGDLRHNQNMANLLGAAFVVRNGRAIELKEAELWVDKHMSVIRSLAIAHEEDDAEDCLNHLLSSRPDNKLTIAEMLAGKTLVEYPEFEHISNSSGPFLDLLKFGVKSLDDGFLVANKHLELNKMFKGTIWENGGWRNALKRLPGAEVGDKHRARFLGGPAVRCVFIPFEVIDDI